MVGLLRREFRLTKNIFTPNLLFRLYRKHIPIHLFKRDACSFSLTFFLVSVILFFMLLLTPQSYASEIIANSEFSSGDTFTFLGKTYVVSVGSSNVQIQSGANGVIIQKNQTKLFDNLQIMVGDIQSQTYQGSTSIYRANLIVKTHEPDVFINVDFPNGFVGHKQTASITFNQSSFPRLTAYTISISLPSQINVTAASGCNIVSDSVEFNFALRVGERKCTIEYVALSEFNNSIPLKLSYNTPLRNKEIFISTKLNYVYPYELKINGDNQVNITGKANASLIVTPKNNISDVSIFLELLVPPELKVLTSSLKKDSQNALISQGFFNYTSNFNLDQESTNAISFEAIKAAQTNLTVMTYFILDDVRYNGPSFQHDINISNPAFVALQNTTLAKSSLSQIVSNLTSYLDFNINVSSLTQNQTTDIYGGKEYRVGFDITPLCNCILDDVTINARIQNKNISAVVSKAYSFEKTRSSPINVMFANVSKPTQVIVPIDVSFFINGTFVNFSTTKNITLLDPGNVSIRKVITPSRVNSGEMFRVDVYVTPTKLGALLPINVTEEIPSNFVTFGVTSRVLSITQESEVLAYSYTGYAPNVNTNNTFQLKTNYNYHIRGIGLSTGSVSQPLIVEHPPLLKITPRNISGTVLTPLNISFDIVNEFPYEIYNVRFRPMSFGDSDFPNTNFPAARVYSVNSIKPNQTITAWAMYVPNRVGAQSRFVVKILYDTEQNVTIQKDYNLAARVTNTSTQINSNSLKSLGFVNRTIFKEGNRTINQSYTLYGFGSFQFEISRGDIQNITLPGLELTEHNLGPTLTNAWMMVNGARYSIPILTTNIEIESQIAQSMSQNVQSNSNQNGFDSNSNPISQTSHNASIDQIGFIASSNDASGKFLIIVLCLLSLLILLGLYAYIKFKPSAQSSLASSSPAVSQSLIVKLGEKIKLLFAKNHSESKSQSYDAVLSLESEKKLQRQTKEIQAKKDVAQTQAQIQAKLQAQTKQTKQTENKQPNADQTVANDASTIASKSHQKANPNTKSALVGLSLSESRDLLNALNQKKQVKSTSLSSLKDELLRVKNSISDLKSPKR
jgi:hypothetical protein